MCDKDYQARVLSPDPCLTSSKIKLHRVPWSLTKLCLKSTVGGLD